MKRISRLALKARKGTPGGGGTMPTPEGLFHENRGHHRVGGRVDHRDVAGSLIIIRDIDVFPVRGDGDPLGLTPQRDLGHFRVGGRVDHKNGAADEVYYNREIGVFPIRRDGNPKGIPGKPKLTTALVAVSITQNWLNTPFVT